MGGQLLIDAVRPEHAGKGGDGGNAGGLGALVRDLEPADDEWAAIEAGVDCVEVSIVPFANGTSQPDTQRMLALLEGHPRCPQFDRQKLAAATQTHSWKDVLDLAPQILAGKIRGRVVLEVG